MREAGHLGTAQVPPGPHAPAPAAGSTLGPLASWGNFPLGFPKLLDWQRRALGELFPKLQTFGPFPSPGAQL